MTSSHRFTPEAGPVVADLVGSRVSPKEHALLRHPALGGIILFTRNYEHPDQLRDLCAEIRDVAGRPLLLSVDQEGGRVQRFRPGFTALPPPAWFGAGFERDPDAALANAREAAMTMAFELRRLGVDLSYMPLADLDLGLCAVIGDRAFHRDPVVVHALARAWRQGMRDAGMASVAKHFPGHGGVTGDSHLELPVDDRELAAIEAEDLQPFRQLVTDGVEAVMTAHVRFPKVDQAPPTFSRTWLNDVLRGRLGFDGIIFSDDLSMAAAQVAGDPAGRARAALAAGCDALLVCNDPDAAHRVLDAVEPEDARRPLSSLLGGPLDDGLAERVARFAPVLAKAVA